jgi:hypothetical protein
MFHVAGFDDKKGTTGLQVYPQHARPWHMKTKDLMTHKYRGCIIVLSINKSVEQNEEHKVLISGFDQGFTVNTSKRIFRGIW